MVRKDETIEQTFFFFDFLENHYVSNDEVSKQHLSVIKKSNSVKANDKSTIRSTHPPLETIVITCQDKKKLMLLLSKLLMIKPLLSVLLNKTILLMNPCRLLVSSLTILKKKLLKELFP